MSVNHTSILEADLTGVELVSSAYLGVCACVSGGDFDRVMWQCCCRGTVAAVQYDCKFGHTRFQQVVTQPGRHYVFVTCGRCVV